MFQKVFLATRKQRVKEKHSPQTTTVHGIDISIYCMEVNKKNKNKKRQIYL